jgi:hypothetical protein
MKTHFINGRVTMHDKKLLMAAVSTLDKNLMLTDEAKDMFVDLLMSINFKECQDDLQTLQLFFKRVYTGIEELNKRNKELKEEVSLLKEHLENTKLLPLEKPLFSENF